MRLQACRCMPCGPCWLLACLPHPAALAEAVVCVAAVVISLACPFLWWRLLAYNLCCVLGIVSITSHVLLSVLLLWMLVLVVSGRVLLRACFVHQLQPRQHAYAAVFCEPVLSCS